MSLPDSYERMKDFGSGLFGRASRIIDMVEPYAVLALAIAPFTLRYETGWDYWFGQAEQEYASLGEVVVDSQDRNDDGRYESFLRFACDDGEIRVPLTDENIETILRATEPEARIDIFPGDKK